MVDVATAPERAEPVDSVPETHSDTPRRGLNSHNEFVERYFWAYPVALTFGLAFAGAWRPSLWEDELATWSAARRSWSELWALFDHLDAVTAPYYILMHFWVKLFGDSELSLRAPSILAITAAAAVTSLLGRRFFSARVGLLAGLVFAVLPSVTRVGQEARATAFVLLFTALAVWALVVAVEEPRWWRWARYGGFVVLLGVANLLALLTLAAHAAFVGVRWWRSRDRQPLWWGVSVLGAVVALAPFMYVSHEQAYQVNWIERPAFRAIFDVPTVAGSAVLGGLCVGLSLLALPHLGRARELLVVWLVAPPVLLFVLSIYGSQSYWVTRYFYFLLPALAVLVAVALSQLNRVHLVVAAVVGLALASPIHADVRRTNGHAYDGERVAELIQARLVAGDVAIYGDMDAHGPRDMVRYYGPSRKVLPDPLAIDRPERTGWYDAPECADTAACLDGVDRAWLFRRDAVKEPFERMTTTVKEDYLRGNFHVVETWKFGKVSVYLIERNS